MGFGKDRRDADKACSEPKSMADPDQQNIHQSRDTDGYHQRLLDGVLNNLLDGIITIDIEGTVLSVNLAIEMMSGYSAEELIGNSINILMSDHIAKQHQGFLQRFQEKGEYDIVGAKRYLQIYRKDGSFFLAEIAVSKMQLDDKIIFIGSIYDVTEKVEQEKKIFELARFPEENWNPVMRISTHGKINYANSRCDAILKSWQTEPAGRVPDVIRDLIRHSITEGQNSEFVVACENDIYYKLLISPVPDLKSAYVYGLDISQSIKDQQELEAHRNLLEERVKERTEEAMAARHEAEHANQAKSLFLANMSHEIRTPLTSIIGYAENLLEDKPDEAEFSKSINTIIRSGNHLIGIVNDILDLSKIEADKLEVESLSINLVGVMAEIQSLMNPYAMDKSITFNINYQYPAPKNITTDPVRFKQILLNLCSNAIKFTNEGSVEIMVSYKQDVRALVIKVIDTGIGMTAEQIDRVFKPFVQADVSTTREYGGTGLGLPLSTHLSEILGGKLDLQSEQGKGSCFVLILPVTNQDEAELVTEPAQQKLPQQTVQPLIQEKLQGRVLLAEDTMVLQQLISRYIRKAGLEVDVVDNGEQAVKAALAGDYAIVFMDIQMPVMDGCEAVEILRAKGYDKPIVAVTANAMRKVKEHCLAIGCNDFIAKPVQRDQINTILARYSKAGTNEQDTSLISTLYETDPDVVSLIETFLAVLPDYVDQCQTALATENWEALGHVLHTLKGMGSSYGYKIITETAEVAEQRLKVGDYVGLKPLIEKLKQLNGHAQRAHKQQTG